MSVSPKLSSLLSPVSAIYARIADIRNARFDSGKSKAFELGARTISVGNITAGGTGKTPVVILICEMLAARGERVCILTRGYGRSDPGKRIVVSDGANILADAATGGDEPIEMAQKLGQKAVIIADPDRVAAAGWAKDRFEITYFVLDDGFQHRRAKRDVDIVCIDAMNPFGGGRVLPAGELREPLSGLKRASAVILTRSDLVDDIAQIRLEIEKHNANCPIFTASNRTKGLTPIGEFGSSERTGSVEIPGGRGFAFCGLGNPEAFFEYLRRDGFELAATRAFRDHYVYRPGDVRDLERNARISGAHYLVTTAKDAVKLQGAGLSFPCYVLESELVIDDATRFSDLL